MGRLNTGVVRARMTENPLDHFRLIDARNDPELPVAASARRDLDRALTSTMASIQKRPVASSPCSQPDTRTC
jgi:hypothetical protein